MKEKEKRLAQQLYIYSDASQQKIAEDLGISEKTLSKWKEEEGWDKIKAARNLGKDALVNKLYSQALKITTEAENDSRILNSKEMDTIVKIASTIDKLDRKVNLPNAISVFKEFNNWLVKINPTFAQQLTEFQSKFLHYLNENE
jgi:uncharacterized protein YjcR